MKAPTETGKMEVTYEVFPSLILPDNQSKKEGRKDVQKKGRKEQRKKDGRRGKTHLFFVNWTIIKPAQSLNAIPHLCALQVYCSWNIQSSCKGRQRLEAILYHSMLISFWYLSSYIKNKGRIIMCTGCNKERMTSK